MIIALFALSVTLLMFLVIYGFIKQKIAPQKELSQRLHSLTDGTVTISELSFAEPEVKPESFRERVIIPLRKSIGDFLTNLAPQTWSKILEKKLIIAGLQREWTVGGYAIFYALFMFLALVISIVLVKNKPHIALIQSFMMVLIGVGIGAVIPYLNLQIRIQKRQKAILQQLPELLDLLCVSVQAGLTFDAALYRIVTRMHGPLINECTRMLEDVRMGLPRRQALKSMSARCDVPELTLFASAVIQAERLGTSLSTTLVNQANNMRERRRQSVKAEALKAPVKMLFPLIIFIFPAIFVVLLLPTLLSLLKTFGK